MKRVTVMAAMVLAAVMAACVVVPLGCRTYEAMGGSPLMAAAAKAAIQSRVPEWLEDAGLPSNVVTYDEVDRIIDELAASVASNQWLDAWALGKITSNDTVKVWVEEKIAALLAGDLDAVVDPDPELPAPAADAEAGWPMTVTRWCGLPAPNAVRDPRVELSVSPDGRRWTVTVDGVECDKYGPAHWTMGNPAISRAVCGVWYPLSDGSFMGGKYEWFRQDRSWENLVNGYGGHREPARKTVIPVAIYSPDARWRSNVVEITYEG